jgi:hypothetical protein
MVRPLEPLLCRERLCLRAAADRSRQNFLVIEGQGLAVFEAATNDSKKRTVWGNFAPEPIPMWIL